MQFCFDPKFAVHDWKILNGEYYYMYFLLCLIIKASSSRVSKLYTQDIAETLALYFGVSEHILFHQHASSSPYTFGGIIKKVYTCTKLEKFKLEDWILAT